MPVYINKDDALKGDRIAVSARQISQIVVKTRTGSHRGQFTTLRDNAYCIIEVPYKFVLNKKK